MARTVAAFSAPASDGLYLGSLAALNAGISGAFWWEARGAWSGFSTAHSLFLGMLALFPASELATYLLQMFLTWILPPRVLPKMSFEEGIPEDCRTLVVVPMMLLTPECGPRRDRKAGSALLRQSGRESLVLAPGGLH